MFGERRGVLSVLLLIYVQYILWAGLSLQVSKYQQGYPSSSILGVKGEVGNGENQMGGNCST